MDFYRRDNFCVGVPCWFKSPLLWGAYVKDRRPPDSMPPGLPQSSTPPPPFFWPHSLLIDFPNSCWHPPPPISALHQLSPSSPLNKAWAWRTFLSFSSAICRLPDPLDLSIFLPISTFGASSPLFVSSHPRFLSVNDPSILTGLHGHDHNHKD